MPKGPTDPEARDAWLAFQELPNVGPAMASDLVRLDLRSTKQLAKASPKALYERIGGLDGTRHDPCVLDTFEAVVHYLRTGEDLPWWEFSRRRKAQAAPKPPR